jgi:hypothetical protein
LDPKDWYGEGGELFGEVPSHRDNHTRFVVVLLRYTTTFTHTHRANTSSSWLSPQCSRITSAISLATRHR